MFSAADVFFWAQGRKTLPQWGVDSLERQLGIQKTWAGSRVIFAAARFLESHQMVWVECKIGNPCLFPGQLESAHCLGSGLGREIWDNEG